MTARQHASRMAAECIGVRIRLLNRIVTNVYDTALRPLGLKTSQLNVLAAAAYLGVARPAEVAERLQMDVSTLSRNIDRMKNRGWLEVVPDEDGRMQPFQLTREGQALFEKAFPLWEKAQQQVETLLGDDGVTHLRAAAEDFFRIPPR